MRPNPLLLRPLLPKAALPAILPGAGYRFGPQPAWVKASAVSSTAPALTGDARGSRGWAGASGSRALRQLLVDVQIQQTAKPVLVQRLLRAPAVTMALDASTLREVSGAADQLQPIPAAHHSQRGPVVRDSQRINAWPAAAGADAREHNLERQMIDSVRTALIVIQRRASGRWFGRPTVEGDNPIFDGAWPPVPTDVPIDRRLHWRLEAPLETQDRRQALASSVEPRRFEEGSRQVLRDAARA